MSTITMPELTEVEGKLTERRAKMKSIFDEAGPTMDFGLIKSLDGDNASKVEAVRAINSEIDELSVKAEGLRQIQRIAEGVKDEEDKVEKGADSDAPKVKTLADHFLESDAYKHKGMQSELDVDFKTLMQTSAGWAPYSERRDTFVPYATRPIELIDIVPNTTTGAASIDYFEETTFTNNAAETSEGATKPEAALALTLRNAPVRKIAVLLPITDEQLEDVPRVRSYVNDRLPFMVRQRLSGQIVSGDGSAPNLRGILNVSGIQTQAKGSDPTPDAVYKAMVLVMTGTGQAMPDAAVFNPLDWQDVRLLRTSDGIYIWGSPSDAGPERIWGLRVVLAQTMTQNTAVVGDFGHYSELAIRKGLTVDVGLNSDDFAKNRQTFRAELRCALIFPRPAAFCSVTGV